MMLLDSSYSKYESLNAPLQIDNYIHPLFQFDWRQVNEGSFVYILDYISFEKINATLLESTSKTYINHVNQAIIRKTQEGLAFCEPVLIDGVSEEAHEKTLRIKIISKKANEYIFKRCGYSGRPVCRKIINTGFSKQIELYPRRISFQLFSAHQLKISNPINSYQDQGDKVLNLPKQNKFQINIYDSQNGRHLQERIEDMLIKHQSPHIQDIKIYKVNPELFDISSFERTLEYYYFKQDLQYIALAQQKSFYQIIDNKEYDDFIAQFFPGKLLHDDDLLNDFLKEGDKLVVQYFSESRWVFPSQPSFSVAKRCSYCKLLSQLYLDYCCCKCREKFMYCSRVCHFQDLRAHRCVQARQQLTIIYGKEYYQIIMGIQTKDSSSSNKTKNSSPKEKQNQGQVIPNKPPSQITPNNSDTDQQNSSINLDLSPQKIKNPLSHNNKLDSSLKISKSSSKNHQWGSQKGRGGIQNIGNTCYINSSLQMISRTVLAKTLSHILDTSSKPLLKGYLKLLKYLEEATPQKGVYQRTIKAFKDVIDQELPYFRGYMQHDAHQFITFFLDKIHSQTKQRNLSLFQENYRYNLPLEEQARHLWLCFLQSNKSPITSLFHGQLLTRTKCPHCNSESRNFEPFNALSCAIPVNVKPPCIQFSHQTQDYRTRIQIVKVQGEGKLQELIQMYQKQSKNMQPKVSKQEYQYKMFSVSSEGIIKEYESDKLISQIVSETRKEQTKTQKRLFLFEANIPKNPKMLIVRFNDKNNAPITFKRPFFFESDRNITGQALYTKIRNFLHRVFNTFYRYNYDALERALRQKVESLFTITYYTKGVLSKDERVVFKKAGAVIHADDKILSEEQGLCQLWVTLNKGDDTKPTDVRNVFYDTISNKIRKHQRDTKKYTLNKQDNKQVPVQLLNCLLEEYSKTRTLDQGNEWFCHICQQKRRAYLTNSIYKANMYLLIQIKRFNRNYDGFHFEKNTTRVQLPLQLNLQKILQSPTLPQAYYQTLSSQKRAALKLQQPLQLSRSPMYRLRAMILHKGSANTGHYKALCAQGQQWWLFNDLIVHPVKIVQEIKTPQIQEQAYILLYEKAIN